MAKQSQEDLWITISYGDSHAFTDQTSFIDGESYTDLNRSDNVWRIKVKVSIQDTGGGDNNEGGS